MNMKTHAFREQVRSEFQQFLDHSATRFPEQDSLRIDLHCHDHNSDVPDELWGRILRLPETWIPTGTVIEKLQKSRAGAYTITNHNNARSCWELLDKGFDILPGAEFTCNFPEMGFDAHVLAYGFTPTQESQLFQLRHDAQRFLDFAVENDIPTVLPHPLYLYHGKAEFSIENYQKLALMFERFEVMNGQRDVFQNLLVKEWIGSLTPETLESWSKKHGIPLDRWCRDPFRKRTTGGSDDHFALFTGGSGTTMHVTGLQKRLRSETASKIALDALRHADMVPFGTVAEDEKLTIAFLDYFCQVAMNMEDPGLLRLFLHRGDLKDKMICLAVANGMLEMRRHKYTMKFLKVFHESLHGQKPGLIASLGVSKDYRPMLEDLKGIAQAAEGGPEAHREFMVHIESMFLKINRLISSRMSTRIGERMASPEFQALSVDEAVRRFELPSQFRNLSNPEPERRRKDMTNLNISDILDQLSFPALFYGIMGGARFMSARVLYHDRATVNAFARSIGKHEHPKRILWLTDTLMDKNGVASVLKVTLQEVCRRELPVDFLICSDDAVPQDHLHVVPSMGSFSLPNYSDQVFRFPNIMDVHKVFLEGGYDRVVCSTEALMGVVALYLKQAFSVPIYFYMHTDWLDYARRMAQLDVHSLDRVRRILRALYRAYDGVFVLNTEHREWLTSRAIGIKPRRVFLTAHWTEGEFAPPLVRREHIADAPVILFAGRLSLEKGVMDLPLILAKVKESFPHAVLRIAGTGVAEPQMRAAMPDAEFLGWVGPAELAQAYGKADFLLLPSRFDTFGCVVIEAMACGLPVVAYNTKGPRDIIEHGVSGLLGEDAVQLGEMISESWRDGTWEHLSQGAIQRSTCYDKVEIMDRMLADIGIR